MNLYEKLVEVRKSVPYLKKDQRMSFGNVGYNYVSSEAALTSIRAKMDELGVLLVPRISNQEILPQEGKNITTLIAMSFLWINAEKPEETLLCEWAGQGMDASERGLGKAITYSTKYFVLAFFQIPTPKDDPDASPTQRNKLPDVTRLGWQNSRAGFRETCELTWGDMIHDRPLPNGKSSASYLHKLAAWTAQPKIAEVAKFALQVREQEKEKAAKKQEAEDPPF